jgi:hypothetical protein
MPFADRLSSLFTRFRSPVRWRGSNSGESDLAQSPHEPALNPADEFLKIQRSLRRLSLASDRSGEILHTVSGALDEVRQALLRMNRPQQTALTLDEAQLLNILDRLDQLARVPDVPAAARSLNAEAITALLAGARWQPVAFIGAKPVGSDIRVAEFIGDTQVPGHADAIIHQVIEQGYRRCDGTLLRPGVVIAAAAPVVHPNLLS